MAFVARVDFYLQGMKSPGQFAELLIHSCLGYIHAVYYTELDRTRRDLVLAEAFSPRVANANRTCCNSTVFQYHSLVNSLSATYKKNLAGAIAHPHYFIRVWP